MEENLCRTEIEAKISKDCGECGLPVVLEEMCLLDLDVVALFPSISARMTGDG